MRDEAVSLGSWPAFSVMEEDKMLNVTAAAGEFLSDVLETSNAPAGAAVRLSVQADGLSAAIDEARPGDASIDHEGRKVLLLDRQAASALSEKTLDLQATPEGRRLGIR